MEGDLVAYKGYTEKYPSPREQELFNYIEQLWAQPHKPSPDTVKHILHFLVQLPEIYQLSGMAKIAEYLSGILSIHFLDLLATFQQNAEHEGIDKEEITQTINSTLSDLFPDMLNMSKHISIKSIDDLITFSNITFSLHTLSQPNTAEDAQSWIYELPVLYHRQLTQERLLTTAQVQSITITKSTKRARMSSQWQSTLPKPATIEVVQLNKTAIA